MNARATYYSLRHAYRFTRREWLANRLANSESVLCIVSTARQLTNNFEPGFCLPSSRVYVQDQMRVKTFANGKRFSIPFVTNASVQWFKNH